MTVYIDDLVNYPTSSISPKARRFGNSWCHMWTDGNEEELHEMARKIGMKRSWFQDKRIFPHYDLVFSKRKLAIENGAKFMPLAEWFKKRKNV